MSLNMESLFSPQRIMDDDVSNSNSNSNSNSCSSSSSINGGGEMETCSSTSPLQDMSSLLLQLPLKRGLSKHYNGKSQSFTSLSKVERLEDLAKQENPFNKKLKTCKSYGGFPRKHASSSTNKSRSHFSSHFNGRRNSSFLQNNINNYYNNNNNNNRPPIPPPHRSTDSLIY